MIPLNEQKTGSRICRSRLRYENRIGIDWHKITQTSCVLHICLAQKTNQSHETSWNLERVHIYMHVRPWLKWWNSNRPVHRRRVLTWPGLHIVVQTRDGPQNPLDSLWMTKLSGFLGQEFHLGLKIGSPHSFYSFVISDLSKYHGYPPFRDLHVVSTSPCLDILVTSFGFLSIVQTPVLLGASRTKVGENAWIAWVLETRNSC